MIANNENSSPKGGEITETELGVILSHLHTIRTAYNDGCQVALILEDDVSTALMPFWTYTPLQAVLDATAAKPHWTTIQVRFKRCAVFSPGLIQI